VTHSSRQPHRNRNPGPGRTVVLFCSTPPSFWGAASAPEACRPAFPS